MYLFQYIFWLGHSFRVWKKQIEKSSWLLFILLLFQLKNSLLILSFPKIVHAESSSSLLLRACLSQYDAWFLLPNKLWPQVFFLFSLKMIWERELQVTWVTQDPSELLTLIYKCASLEFWLWQVLYFSNFSASCVLHWWGFPWNRISEL